MQHRKNLAALKKSTAARRTGGFDKSRLNSNFFNNAKTAKDKVEGWAFDFENPDANSKSTEDDIVQMVKQQSV